MWPLLVTGLEKVNEVMFPSLLFLIRQLIECTPSTGLIMGVWRSHHSVGNIFGTLLAALFVEWNVNIILLVLLFIDINQFIVARESGDFLL